MDAIHVLQDPFPAPEVARARTAFDSAESQIVAEQYGTSRAPVRFAYDDGTKFAGGYGVTKLLAADYWTLRARSSQLFETNIYARGVIRRLVTNVINTGLSLEATPEEKILGKEEDELADWSEMVENRFQLWCDSPRLCDQAELKTFGAIQAEAYREALIEGDVLVVLRQDPRTGLPRLQLIKGSNVRTPWGITETGPNEIKHGVEVDPSGRHVAFYVTQKDGTAKRLPAFGEKSGRRLAWLVYASDKRLDDVRGKPLLSLILQSLQEVDRYRDSTQRKAVVLSMLAMYIEKTQDKLATLPMSAGAVRHGQEIQQTADGDRVVRTSEHVPGLVMEDLSPGEKPHAFKVDGSVETFKDFEQAIIQAVAWALEIPPEILTLSFNSNYSASQAALNEFKMFLNMVRTLLGDGLCKHVYIEWLIAECTSRRTKAEGFLESWRDWSRYDIFAAWTTCDWSGQIKPAVDLTKLVGAYAAAIAEGFIDRARATRELFGLKHSKVVKRIKRENEELAEALKPMAAIEAAKKAPQQGAGEAGKKSATGQGEDGADDAVEN
jgi:lambda family phage portal protein